MARESQDREDLLREATALVERAELLVIGEPEPVIVGFRRDGCLSLFFGPDPVYQFNTRNELRRAYVAERLYKAEHGRLVALDRRREGGALQLVRHELDPAGGGRFMQEMTARLASLLHALSHQQYTITGQVPAGAAVVDRVRDWLAAHITGIRVSASPHAK